MTRYHNQKYKYSTCWQETELEKTKNIVGTGFFQTSFAEKVHVKYKTEKMCKYPLIKQNIQEQLKERVLWGGDLTYLSFFKSDHQNDGVYGY